MAGISPIRCDFDRGSFPNPLIASRSVMFFTLNAIALRNMGLFALVRMLQPILALNCKFNLKDFLL
jgi:hypothetical protein